MTRIASIGLVLLGIFGCCGQDLPERAELFTRTTNGTYRIHAVTEAVATGRGPIDLLLCLPYPESNKYQTIAWRTPPTGAARAVWSETGHPYLKYAAVVTAPATVAVVRDFDVSLYRVAFDWSAVTTLFPYETTHAEYRRYTRPYPCDCADTNAFRAAYAWVDGTTRRLRANASTDLAFISNAYRTVTTTFKYGPWPGGFTNLIARKQGDCGGISTAFVSLLRAGGVPARLMVCLRPDQSPHVWSEFYLQNYGWVPADPTFDLGRSDGFKHFGTYRDNTIVMTYDKDFTVATAEGRVQRNVFVQSLAWWWFWHPESPTAAAREVKLRQTWEARPQ